MPHLKAAPVPRMGIPKPGTTAWTAFLHDYIRDGFVQVREGRETTAGARPKHGIQFGKAEPCGEQVPHLRSAWWHTRTSVHDPSDGIGYEQFAQGLLQDHTVHEQEYIPTLVKAERLEALVPGVAEIWHLHYRTPAFVRNRDFIQLVLTLALPDHTEPFSEAHEVATLNSLVGGPIPDTAPGGPRSFLVVNQPVSEMNEPPVHHIRAFYASAEGVWETARGGPIAWLMSVQTDSAGWVPSWMQEKMMPAKIGEDVPCFLTWAKTRRAGEPQPAE
ncbi:hypothetical protein MSPP1_002585 [Malassezia sp. CBS 17886]|nr:hypothetical protein MSPP1_002585 [Malassezia sp. CBS 17886]